MVESFPDSVRGARCSTSRGSIRGRSGAAMLRVAVVVCGRDASTQKRIPRAVHSRRRAAFIGKCSFATVLSGSVGANLAAICCGGSASTSSSTAALGLKPVGDRRLPASIHSTVRSTPSILFCCSVLCDARLEGEVGLVNDDLILVAGAVEIVGRRETRATEPMLKAVRCSRPPAGRSITANAHTNPTQRPWTRRCGPACANRGVPQLAVSWSPHGCVRLELTPGEPKGLMSRQLVTLCVVGTETSAI